VPIMMRSTTNREARREADGARRAAAPVREGLLLALFAGLVSCGSSAGDPWLRESSGDGSPEPTFPEPTSFAEPPPELSEGVFPCSDCHEADLPVRGTPRKLRAHQEIVLKHDVESGWCFDCHTKTNFDKLHLASGELIDFESSIRLCAQCHGEKYREWRSGVHGRRTGNWDGEKTYLLCSSCHEAHAPAFRPIAPEPPPRRPKRTR